jgi:LysM repeat protein
MKKVLLSLVICMLLAPLLVLPAAAAPSEVMPIVHIVQWGENLTNIAWRYGTTVHAIMYANGISNPNRIYAGQRLLIPVQPAPAPAYPAPAPAPTTGGCVYYVRHGDTLSGIAYRHGVTVNAIVRLNYLANPNCIYPGQRLNIPCPSQPAPKPKPKPGGVYYIVRPGDTLAKIAVRYGVSTWSIVRANNIANPNVIYVGQRLYIPSGTPAPVHPQPSKPGCEHMSWPKAGAWLGGVIEAWGTTEIDNFWYYKLEYRHDGLDDWHYIDGAETAVEDGPLGNWDTRTVADGTYIFRLVVVDKTGNYPPPCEIPVHVNNDP